MQEKLDLESFAGVALSDGAAAHEMLAAHPEIAGASLYGALVTGDAAAVEKALRENPSVVTLQGGPRGWQPLLYVCFSRMKAAGLVETARVLLRHGANPNASYIAREYPDSPLSCLYGATGLNNNPELGLALLEAGANPNDSESLYHSTEYPDWECVRLLLAHGASAAGGNILKHMLDRDLDVNDAEGVQLLLTGGADPNEADARGETALHWAISRGRSAQIVEALLKAGAAVDAKRSDGRTAYALARQTGHVEIAALLEMSGASTELTPLDSFIAACENAGPDELAALLAQPPEVSAADGRLVSDLASAHRTTAVRALLAAGLPVDARGEHGATALHWACWKGYADLVTLLLQHGASLDIQDEQFHARPRGWFGHGLENCCEEGGDYLGVARALIDAGAEMPLEDTDPAVHALLREHGLVVPK